MFQIPIPDELNHNGPLMPRHARLGVQTPKGGLPRTPRSGAAFFARKTPKTPTSCLLKRNNATPLSSVKVNTPLSGSSKSPASLTKTPRHQNVAVDNLECVCGPGERVGMPTGHSRLLGMPRHLVRSFRKREDKVVRPCVCNMPRNDVKVGTPGDTTPLTPLLDRSSSIRDWLSTGKKKQLSITNVNKSPDKKLLDSIPEMNENQTLDENRISNRICTDTSEISSFNLLRSSSIKIDLDNKNSNNKSYLIQRTESLSSNAGKKSGPIKRKLTDALGSLPEDENTLQNGAHPAKRPPISPSREVLEELSKKFDVDDNSSNGDAKNISINSIKTLCTGELSQKNGDELDFMETEPFDINLRDSLMRNSFGGSFKESRKITDVANINFSNSTQKNVSSPNGKKSTPKKVSSPNSKKNTNTGALFANLICPEKTEDKVATSVPNKILSKGRFSHKYLTVTSNLPNYIMDGISPHTHSKQNFEAILKSKQMKPNWLATIKENYKDKSCNSPSCNDVSIADVAEIPCSDKSAAKKKLSASKTTKTKSASTSKTNSASTRKIKSSSTRKTKSASKPDRTTQTKLNFQTRPGS